MDLSLVSEGNPPDDDRAALEFNGGREGFVHEKRSFAHTVDDRAVALKRTALCPRFPHPGHSQAHKNLFAHRDVDSPGGFPSEAVPGFKSGEGVSLPPEAYPIGNRNVTMHFSVSDLSRRIAPLEDSQPDWRHRQEHIAGIGCQAL